MMPEWLAPPFEVSADGTLFLVGKWPLCIQVAEEFIDAVTRGEIVPGTVSVTATIDPQCHPLLVSPRWTTMHFKVGNGEATYLFDEQDAWARQSRVWRGHLRDGITGSFNDGAFLYPFLRRL